MEEQNVLDALDAIRSEAVKNAVNAFNEGYLLGAQYAKQLYKENKSKRKSGAK
ncbi:hypothetical protein IJH24_03485 [Candidatus Saccharibacteria bacterium]|nr:hypothetical protein [Candidatus Saccharibacteria bacterium]